MRKYCIKEILSKENEENEEFLYQGIKFKAIKGVLHFENGTVTLNDDKLCSYWSKAGLTIDLLEAEYVRVIEEKPVPFQEVLNSNNKCRIEHPLLEGSWWEIYKDFDLVMYELSSSCGINKLKEIIRDGKWYLENKEE